MAEIKLINLVKQFGDVTAVNKIDLEVRDKEFLALVGPSGCGKSTCLRMIAGLDDPTRGEIYIDGTIIGQTPLNNPVRLEAGKHVLMIKNPGYPEYKKAFTVRKNDTISFNINLNKRSLTNTTDSI